MNNKQAKRVLELISFIKNQDFGRIIEDAYEKKIDVFIKIFDKKFTPIEVVNSLYDVLDKIKILIDEKDSRVISHNTINDDELEKQLGLIYTKVSTGDSFDNWVINLESVIKYAFRNNIIDSKIYFDQSKNLQSDRMENDFYILLSQSAEMRKMLEESKEEFDKFRVTAQSSYKGLSADMESAISRLRNSELSNADSQGKLEIILYQLTESANEAKAIYEKVDNDHKEIIKKFSEIENDFEERKNTVNDIIVYAQKKAEHILDQEKQINDLRGFAAGAALGGVFGQRSNQMSRSINIWIGLSVVAVCLAAYWVNHVFDSNIAKGSLGMNWLMWLTNVVRTSPAFILVYFCLSQYTKERNIQEEYAFKAAVSMTVTPYAEMIGSEASGDDERIKMLVTTIQGIYTPPALGKPFKPFSIRTKDVAESSKSMSEMMKTMQTVLADIIKAGKPS